MRELSEEEVKQWLHHPVTRSKQQQLQVELQQVMQEWLAAGYSGRTYEGIALDTVRVHTQAATLERIEQLLFIESEDS